MRLGIFGGTFNPVHNGHLRTAEEARCKLKLDKVMFVPSGKPPLKETGAVGASHRFAMVALAAASNKDFIVSGLEAGKRGKTYTIDTLRKLCREYPGESMFLILGVDAFLDLPKWRQPRELTAMTDFAVVSRPGFGLDAVAGSPYVKGMEHRAGNNGISVLRLESGRRAFLLTVTALDISSTGIRRLIGQGKSVKYLLPASVERYIKKHKLYLGNDNGV